MKKKKNQKNFKTFLKNNAVKIWIALAVLSLAGMIVYAAYPNKQNILKKVIATSADKNMRFSSNYLEEGVTKYKTIVLGDTVVPIFVYIRNYTRNNDGLRYPNDITYVFTATLTDSTGIMPEDDGYAARIASVLDENESIRIDLPDNTSISLSRNNYSGTFNHTLLKGDARQDEYQVVFPKTKSKACILLTATPTPETSYTDLSSISAVLSVSDREATSANGWAGSFNDSRTGGRTPQSYDAYNYTLSGHGESTTATFSWDFTKVEVNRQYFESHFGVDFSHDVTTVGDWKTVTIHIGQNGAVRYDFQIFKAGSTELTWAILDQAVQFDDGLE